AWENSSVVAWENSSVVAWGNSSVVAWGNSSVEAWDQVGIQGYGAASILLYGLAVLWLHNKLKFTKKSKTATVREVGDSVIRAKKGAPKDWLAKNGVDPVKGKITLFKRVSKDFKTQEGCEWETTWTVGATMDHPNWSPAGEECHAGKFHGCPRPYFCDEFRSTPGDRYVALEVAVKDLYAWDKPGYPHKIAFRRGIVLYECDKHGRKKS
ncbi:MAG: hypothetical protein WC100_03555, partial [Sterolibacterium sp.]